MKLRYQELVDQYCASEVINTLISIKRQCESRFRFTFTVRPGGYGAVRDLDIVGILYNLLDNAVEENERFPDMERQGHLASDGEADKESPRIVKPETEKTERNAGDVQNSKGI